MKTTALNYTTSKVAKDGTQFDINIRLDDECKNGHQDFSITGSSYKKGATKIERNMISSGAMGDRIAKEFPEFAIFDKLHLCDFAGAPMYAEANGFYHIHRMSAEEFCQYFRCTAEQYETLKTAENQQHYAALLYLSGLPKQWEKEAKKAISLLEKWTGNKFVNNSTKRHFDTPDMAAYKERVKEGYYLPEAIQQRKEHARMAIKNAAYEKITKERDEEIDKANKIFEVKKAVLDSGLSLKNFIFYSHTNEAVFNWLDYEDKITEEQLSAANLLVEGVTFKLKKS